MFGCPDETLSLVFDILLTVLKAANVKLYALYLLIFCFTHDHGKFEMCGVLNAKALSSGANGKPSFSYLMAFCVEHAPYN